MIERPGDRIVGDPLGQQIALGQREGRPAAGDRRGVALELPPHGDECRARFEGGRSRSRPPHRRHSLAPRSGAGRRRPRPCRPTRREPTPGRRPPRRASAGAGWLPRRSGGSRRSLWPRRPRRPAGTRRARRRRGRPARRSGAPAAVASSRKADMCRSMNELRAGRGSGSSPAGPRSIAAVPVAKYFVDMQLPYPSAQPFPAPPGSHGRGVGGAVPPDLPAAGRRRRAVGVSLLRGHPPPHPHHARGCRVRGGRAPHRHPDLWRRPERDGGSRRSHHRALPAGIHRHQLRLPGEEGGAAERRLGLSA